MREDLLWQLCWEIVKDPDRAGVWICCLIDCVLARDSVLGLSYRLVDN